jgi:citrate synthase
MPDVSQWRTSVTEIADGTINYRGEPIAGLIDSGGLSDSLWLVLFGSTPTAGQADALRRSLIAALDHGVTAPSTMTARAIASTRSSIPFAVAGGLIAFAGPAHGGAAEEAAKLFVEIRDFGEGSNLAERVESKVLPLLSQKVRIAGYGHPYHRLDPRVVPLMAGIETNHDFREIAKAVETVVERTTGKSLPMNADAAVAGLLLDAGLLPVDVTLVTGLGRAFGLAAHAREEQLNEKPFRAPGLDTVTFVAAERVEV